MSFSNIRHIFFDLDRTLWDFKSNSREVLTEIYNEYGLANKGVRSAMDFIVSYERINEQMWDAYRKGLLSKEKLRSGRFLKVLSLFGIADESIGNSIGDYYVKHSPYKVGLFDHSHEILKYLQQKYALHIITNGFEEVQYIKLRESKLLDYFDAIITSEAAKAKKPHQQIFNYAQELTNAQAKDCLIIGDDIEADINGGKEAGWETIHFDPHREFAQLSGNRIFHLKELESLL